MVVQRRSWARRSLARARRRCLRERWRNSFCRLARVCDRVGGYGLGTMLVMSGLCAGRGLCGLRGGSGGMGGRLRRMEARSCCVGLAGWLREAMEMAGGVSAIGTSTGIPVDKASWEGDETMMMAEVLGWGKEAIVE